MPPVRIVPRLDKVEHSHLCLRLIPELPPFDQLTFQRREKALAEGVVVGVANGSHGGPGGQLALLAVGR